MRLPASDVPLYAVAIDKRETEHQQLSIRDDEGYSRDLKKRSIDAPAIIDAEGIAVEIIGRNFASRRNPSTRLSHGKGELGFRVFRKSGQLWPKSGKCLCSDGKRTYERVCCDSKQTRRSDSTESSDARGCHMKNKYCPGAGQSYLPIYDGSPRYLGISRENSR